MRNDKTVFLVVVLLLVSVIGLNFYAQKVLGNSSSASLTSNGGLLTGAAIGVDEAAPAAEAASAVETAPETETVLEESNESSWSGVIMLSLIVMVIGGGVLGYQWHRYQDE